MTTGRALQYESQADMMITALRENFSAGQSSVFWGGVFSSDPAYNRDNYARLGTEVERLDGEMRAWAENGKTDTGASFSWEKWFDFANTIGSQIASARNEAWEGSYLKVASNTVTQSGADIVDGVKKVVPALETDFRILAAVVALVGIVYLVHTFKRG